MNTQLTRVINVVICPNGDRKPFYVQGKLANGKLRGYVQVKGVSVAGYVSKTGRGGVAYKFHPSFNGKNVELVRPAALPHQTRVLITDPDYTGRVKTGKVVAVAWNHLTPTYSIQPDDRRCKPVPLTADTFDVMD